MKTAAKRHWWSRVGGFWCAMMHEDFTWPIHGHYECRKCHRIYPAPW